MNKKDQPLSRLEKNRKSFSFKFMVFFIKIFFHRPKVKYIAEEFPKEPIVLLANHVGKKVPSKVELYYPRPFMMWGTHEMTEGFKAVHRYLSKTYYHEKKHFPRWFAWLLATIVAPFVNAFAKGMRVIPTYRDYRLVKTMKETIKTRQEGKDIIIYPEDSSEGYKEELETFFAGFVSLLETLYRKGDDAPVFVTYYQKKTKTFVISDKMVYSDLKKQYGDFKGIANALRDKMNELRDK